MKKAQEARDTMHSELEKGNYNSAASSSVKCAINACNALTVAVSGEISTTEKHEDASYLLVEKVEGPDVKQAVTVFRRVVIKKTAVDYGVRLVKEKDAIRSVDNAEHFIRWVETRIPKKYL